MTTATTTASYNLANQSFSRCSNSDGFFDTFYGVLNRSNPEISAMFRATDFTKQNGLLRVALELMLMFERDGDAARQALAKTRESHNRNGLNIRPELYDVWLDCLMKACEKHDQEFDAQLENAWRETLEPSLHFIKSGYDDVAGEAECMSYLRSIDPNLPAVVKNWGHLPESSRAALVAEVAAVK